MPALNPDRPDLTDIADEFVRSIPDLKTRDAVYRVTEKIKQILEYQMDAIESLYDAVTAIEVAMAEDVP